MNISELQNLVEKNYPIQHANLDSIDWQDQSLPETIFQHCVFPRANFSTTTFSGARFNNCHFQECRFTNADLRGASFTDCNFTHRTEKPTGVNFAGCDMRESNFTQCDLNLARFARCDLFSITLQSCNLLGASFEKSDFSHSYGRRAATTRASFLACNLGLSNLADLRLPGCIFTASRLREADLAAIDLTGADLRDCDLYGAILEKAKLDRADLRGADLTGLNLLYLASYRQLKIDSSQQHHLLIALGLDIDP